VTPKDFKRLLARDRHCLHCGRDDDTLIPQHRINRQMGGAGTASKRNQPSNLVVLCSAFNQAIESDPDAAQEARARGWKLESWQDPLFEPVWDSVHRLWVSLDDDFGSVVLLHWDKDLG
jgi:5-methylcytosine-specific restriction endonuclease McrA